MIYKGIIHYQEVSKRTFWTFVHRLQFSWISEAGTRVWKAFLKFLL